MRFKFLIVFIVAIMVTVGCSDYVEKEIDTISLVSFNVKKSTSPISIRALISEQLPKSDMNVIAMQEAKQARKPLLFSNHHYIGGSDGLLTQSDIAFYSQVIKTEFQGVLDSKSRQIASRFTVNGRSLVVINVHLQPRDREASRAQVLEVARYVSSIEYDHLIIVGDFNIQYEGCKNPNCTGREIGYYNSMKSEMESIGLEIIELGPARCWEYYNCTYENLTSIDHIFISDNLEVEESWITQSGVLSDHNMISARLKIKGGINRP